MEQISLNIVPRLTYSPERFLSHHGVRSILEEAEAAFHRDTFSAYFFVGDARSGKTHLCVKLFEMASDCGLFPRIIEGAEFSDWIRAFHTSESDGYGHEEVLIIDNAEQYFSELTPETSGAFVSSIELLRKRGARLIFVSSKELSHFNCDGHVVSRLKAGSGFGLGAPSEDELFVVLEEMARQRGIRLSDRNIKFLLKKLRREIPSLEYYLERLAHLSQVLGKSMKFPLIKDAAAID